LWHVGCWWTGFSHYGSRLPVAGWLTRRVCPHRRVLVRGAVRSWPWWPREHRCRIRLASEEVVLPGVTDLLRLSPGGPDIGVDPLATELVIDRRLTHGATP
jgi:hypothetical protein